MKPTLLYIYPSRSAFVQEDIDFLRSEYMVVENPLSWSASDVPFSLIKQLFFLLKHLAKSSAVVVMFGGYWSLFPLLLAKWFKKPGFLILGGTDCVSYPELQYGSLRKKTLRTFIRLSVKHTHTLLPVDDSLMYSNNTYYETAHRKQGIRHYFPELKTPYQTIDNGFENSFWENKTEKIPNSFVSVAVVSDETRFVLKGFDLIISAAKEFPACTFTLIGLSAAFSSTLEVPQNVKIFPKTEQKEFKKLLAEAEFYLQISISEGFPNSLCEGMSSGCIPIGSSVNAIPRIIGDTGFLLQKRDNDAFQQLLSEVISLTPEQKKELSEKAEHRISSQFPMEKRAQAFLEIIRKSIG